jgi:hypothetical protein
VGEGAADTFSDPVTKIARIVVLKRNFATGRNLNWILSAGISSSSFGWVVKS